MRSSFSPLHTDDLLDLGDDLHKVALSVDHALQGFCQETELHPTRKTMGPQGKSLGLDTHLVLPEGAGPVRLGRISNRDDRSDRVVQCDLDGLLGVTRAPAHITTVADRAVRGLRLGVDRLVCASWLGLRPEGGDVLDAAVRVQHHGVQVVVGLGGPGALQVDVLPRAALLQLDGGVTLLQVKYLVPSLVGFCGGGKSLSRASTPRRASTPPLRSSPG